MDAQILETSPGVFTITLDDITQDWSFSGPFDYSTPGITAEWIEEDPSSNTGLLPFADYGSTEFTNVAVAGSGLSGAALSPVYMSTDSGAITSYPGAVDVSTDSFPLFYGSPSPQVTSVSPDQGSTSGGTEVTIGGSFVTGVEGVDIGGVSVPFSADVLDGTVTAQSPAHSAGTVDVTVTTPGGVSQPSDSDEFRLFAPVPPPPPPPVTSASSTVSHGYWLVGSDGGIFTFGSAQFYGSTGSLHLQRPVVGIVPTTDRGAIGSMLRMVGSSRSAIRDSTDRYQASACIRPDRVCPTRSTRPSWAWCPLPMAAGTSWWLLTGACLPSVTRCSPGLPRYRRLFGNRSGRHARCQRQRLLVGDEHWPRLHVRRRSVLRSARTAGRSGDVGGAHARTGKGYWILFADWHHRQLRRRRLLWKPGWPVRRPQPRYGDLHHVGRRGLLGRFSRRVGGSVRRRPE